MSNSGKCKMIIHYRDIDGNPIGTREVELERPLEFVAITFKIDDVPKSPMLDHENLIPTGGKSEK